MSHEGVDQPTARSHEPPNPSSSATPATGRPHRKAYTGKSGRELSTSAAKRQSVMALGSIKHLQHMYAKSGLASSSPLRMGGSGSTLPLALPGQVLSEKEEDELEEEEFPTSPSPPTQSTAMSFEVQMPSIRLQKEAVYRELAEVCEKWGLVEVERPILPSARRESSVAGILSDDSAYDRTSTASPAPSDLNDEPLVLTLINTTTSAIRTAQRYFLMLPPERLASDGNVETRATEEAGSSSASPFPALGVVTSSRPIPRHSTLGVKSFQTRNVSPERQKQIPVHTSNFTQNPLLRLRKASLATLGALKEMEHRYRLHASEQPNNIEDLKISLADLSLTSADYSDSHPSFQIEDTSASEQSAYSDTCKGHLYRNDISLRDLNKEAQMVKEWIETVNKILYHLSSTAKTPRVRTKSGNLSSESTPVPSWARMDLYGNDRLARVVACLDAHLPPDLRRELDKDSDEDKLYRLSDGQMLCHAYNAVLRKSLRPWGFIPQGSIHDVISLMHEREQSEKTDNPSHTAFSSNAGHLRVGTSSTLMRRASSEGLDGDDSPSSAGNITKNRIGLTFRRLENLRVFVAALKLRYLIQLSSFIDIKAIARKEEGWRDMLMEIACSWVEAAAEEKREEEVESE